MHIKRFGCFKGFSDDRMVVKAIEFGHECIV